MEFKFDLEDVVKDKITGYKGIILGRTEYATGCMHYGVALQKINKDGTISGWLWFDETRLIVISKSKRKKSKPRGGPSPDAPMM